MMADQFQYEGINFLPGQPGTGYHSFLLFESGVERPFGTFPILVLGGEAASMDARIAMAHRRFADKLRRYADAVEAAAAAYEAR